MWSRRLVLYPVTLCLLGVPALAQAQTPPTTTSPTAPPAQPAPEPAAPAASPTTPATTPSPAPEASPPPPPASPPAAEPAPPPPSAAAEPMPPPAAASRQWQLSPQSDTGTEPRWQSGGGFRLDPDPGWSAALGGYGALVALFGTDTRGSYSVGGATLRGRYSNYVLGGYFELSDEAKEGGYWRAAGGMAGVWLPFQNWVDFEVAARAGIREFSDDDVRFGPSGYQKTSPTVGLSLGVSDRAGTGALAGRIGGAFIATYDLSQYDQSWRDEVFAGEDEDPIIRTGESHVGGFSFALALELALDLSGQAL